MSGKAKLTEADIRAIRASNLSYSVLAEMYGVHRVTIGKIVRREKWKHVA
jgi:uncharacterized protein YjcR